MYLTEATANGIQFFQPSGKYKSLVVLNHGKSKSTLQDPIKRLQSINTYKEVATNFRNILTHFSPVSHFYTP